MNRVTCSWKYANLKCSLNLKDLRLLMHGDQNSFSDTMYIKHILPTFQLSMKNQTDIDNSRLIGALQATLSMWKQEAFLHESFSARGEDFFLVYQSRSFPCQFLARGSFALEPREIVTDFIRCYDSFIRRSENPENFIEFMCNHSRYPSLDERMQ